MSCGSRIRGYYGDSHYDRDEIADRLEAEGEYRIAREVRHGDCLDSHDLERAKRALDWQDQREYFDYRVEKCYCEEREEEEE